MQSAWCKIITGNENKQEINITGIKRKYVIKRETDQTIVILTRHILKMQPVK